MYNLPGFKHLILGLHWILITAEQQFSALGLGDNWTWGLAIIALTIIVRLVLFPITWRQYRQSLAMQTLQPKIKELQRKYKDNREKLQAETMKVYQEHRVNPFTSCLPLLLQLPIFISLYAAIKGLGPLLPTNETVMALNNASFLWIPKLGEPDPKYILLVVYVISQMISTELMLATQSDKMQKMLMRAMPIFFVIFLWKFPAGLFVYWVTSNIWTIGQQLLIKKAMKPVELVPGDATRKRSRILDALVAAQNQKDQSSEKTDVAPSENRTAGARNAGERSPAAKKRRPPVSGADNPTAKERSGSAKPRPQKGSRTPPPGKRAKPKPPAPTPRSADDQPSTTE